MCACAEQIFPDLYYLRREKKSHSIFIEMKIRCLHDIPYHPMNVNHTATDLKRFAVKLENLWWPIGAFFFFFFFFLFSIFYEKRDQIN